MDGGKQIMRGLIVIVAIICLLAPGCSYTGDTSQWDYYSPDNVRCVTEQMKWCRQYGSKLICECIV